MWHSEKEASVKEWVSDAERQIPRWTSSSTVGNEALSLKRRRDGVRGVSQTPKGKKKKNWWLGCWKARIVLQLCLNWISFTVIKFSPEALDRCKIQGLSSPSEWKWLSKWWTSFFHQQITGVPVMDWRFIGEYSCPPITTNYITNTWLKHERMNDRTFLLSDHQLMRLQMSFADVKTFFPLFFSSSYNTLEIKCRQWTAVSVSLHVVSNFFSQIYS